MILPDTHIGRLMAWLRGWPRSHVSALVEGRDAHGHFYTHVAARVDDMPALEEATEALLSDGAAELIEVAEAKAGGPRIPPDRTIVQTTGRTYFAVDLAGPEREREHV
ncbi:MAG: hypothetical protein AAFP13_14340 [Pseudomonadota bacterium]